MPFNQKYPCDIPTATCDEGQAYKASIYNYSFTVAGILTHIFNLDSIIKVISFFIDNGKDNDDLVPRCSAKEKRYVMITIGITLTKLSKL